MMTQVKEIYREFNLAKKHFIKAVELAKKSVIVGEINFPETGKKARERKIKVTLEPEVKDLPDVDKESTFYGKKRKNVKSDEII